MNWQTVLWGIALQFLFAMCVLRWSAGYEAFKWLGDRVTEFLAYSNAGAKFIFGESYTDHLFAFQVDSFLFHVVLAGIYHDVRSFINIFCVPVVLRTRVLHTKLPPGWEPLSLD